MAIGSVPLTCVVRLTPESEPPSVRLPELVTVPLSVMPLTVPVPATLVTVPVPPVAAIVIEPAPLVTLMPEPAVIAAAVYPVPLPIRSWPFVGVDVIPVPPLPIGSVPVTCDVRLTPVSVPPRVSEPDDVTVPVRVRPLTVPVPATLVTVPVVELVPAPIALRKVAASKAETVLSALKRGNVTALGLVIVKRLSPSVVDPSEVRAPQQSWRSCRH